RASLGPLRVLHPVQDRVPVRAVERLEEGSRGLVRVERALEVIRHGRGALALVRPVPPSVRLRALDLAQAGRSHLTPLDQLEGGQRRGGHGLDSNGGGAPEGRPTPARDTGGSTRPAGSGGSRVPGWTV